MDAFQGYKPVAEFPLIHGGNPTAFAAAVVCLSILGVAAVCIVELVR